jgi:hypothetical protein
MHLTTYRLPYKTLINAQIAHVREIHKGLSLYGSPAQIWFVSATFGCAESDGCCKSLNSLQDHLDRFPPEACIIGFEKFYVRVLRKLIKNPERRSKRDLQPRAYVYVDYPGSKCRSVPDGPSLPRDMSDQLPHIHCVMVIPPSLCQAFSNLVPELERIFRQLHSGHQSLDAKLIEFSQLSQVMRYSSKLMRTPDLPTSLRDTDLYTILPKPFGAEHYKKPRWWREEIQIAVIQERRLRKRERARARYKYVYVQTEEKRQTNPAQSANLDSR